MSLKTKYFLTLVLSMAVSLLLIYTFGFFSVSHMHEKFRILADACTLPATVLISLFLLLKISRSGLFDIFGYGASRLSAILIPKRPRDHETYGDYKTRIAKREHTTYTFLLHIGVLFFTFALIFVILFYKSV